METTMIMPLLGSELQCSGKEAMVGILQETMKIRNKKEGQKILLTEFFETVQIQEKESRVPSIFKFSSTKCWNSMWEMNDEGLLTVHQKDDKEESWIMVNPTLTKLISPETPKEEKKKILVLCEQNKLKAEEIKKQQKVEQEKNKPAPQKIERPKTSETGIRKYLPKFLK